MLITMLLTLLAQNQPPVGMVLMADPAVQIQRGATRSAARLGDLLYAGDRVTTGTGQVVFLFCPSNEKLTAKTNVDLSASEAKAANAAALTRAAAKCVLPRVALGSESLERVGGVRARGNPPIPLYLGGTISTPRPAFGWAAFPGTQEYRLSLTDENDKLLWEYRGQAVTANYPSTMPALAGDVQFRWELLAQADGKTIAQQSASFQIKPNAEFASAPAGDAASLLLRATELENAGYLAEAASYYRKLRDANPDDKRLTSHLTMLYWNAGLLAAYNEEFSRTGSQK